MSPYLSHTYTLACWKPLMGREIGLPSTGRKRMEEEGTERKGGKKGKTRSYTSEQKEKSDRK